MQMNLGIMNDLPYKHFKYKNKSNEINENLVQSYKLHNRQILHDEIMKKMERCLRYVPGSLVPHTAAETFGIPCNSIRAVPVIDNIRATDIHRFLLSLSLLFRWKKI